MSLIEVLSSNWKRMEIKINRKYLHELSNQFEVDSNNIDKENI